MHIPEECGPIYGASIILLNNMRMACDSTFLIDKETYISPKLRELKNILFEKLDILNTDSKILIFSEWVTMLSLIGKMLKEEGIGFVQLTGRVAVKNRSKLINKFENDPHSKVFLSSEAGGSGLNLQMADTVINFELPWNPAQKNQRIGRVNRIGQKSKNLRVINLITKNSIEIRIASGLTLKQNLFESVLNANVADTVDFSSSGKGQFIRQLEEMMEEFKVIEQTQDGLTAIDELPEAGESEDEELLQTVEQNVTKDHNEEPEQLNGLPDRHEQEQLESMEKVMNQGMEFLAGLYKMSTGKEADFANQKVEVDKDTGEVVMRFKITKFG